MNNSNKSTVAMVVSGLLFLGASIVAMYIFQPSDTGRGGRTLAHNGDVNGNCAFACPVNYLNSG